MVKMSEETNNAAEVEKEGSGVDKNSTGEDNKCDKCEKTFVSARGVKRHIRFCTGKTPSLETRLRSSNTIVAPIAGTKGITEYDLICDEEDENDDPISDEPCFCCGDLLKKNHKNGPHTCFMCPKTFTTNLSLEKHISNLHAVIPTYGCPECPCTCRDQSTLNRHRAMDHGGKGVLFVCPQCEKTFTRKYHLDRHLQQTGCNGTPRLSLPCQVCGRKFSRKDNLREHLRAHMGEAKPKKQHKCEICNKVFHGTTVYNVHVRTHTGERPFPCTVEGCNKEFSSSNALKKHTRTHTGERPYECEVCHNRFGAKETLNRHVKTHTADKPFKCEYCGKTFIQSTQLRAHLFHHTGEYGYVCKDCGKAFNRKSRLRLHERFIHEGEKPLECDGCDKTFMRKEDLAKHRIVHTGIKDFECNICKKKFATKPSLTMHTRIHVKEEPRSCHTCGRAFIRRDCLYRHMRAKHRDQLEEIISKAEKKKLKLVLLKSMQESEPTEEKNGDENDEEIVDDPDQNDEKTSGDTKVGFLSEDALRKNIHLLLNLLIDEETLAEFGWPEADVAEILESVISRCGHEPAREEDYEELVQRIRENAKLLFTSVIDDTTITTLLNNRTVDEVILHVLKLSNVIIDEESGTNEQNVQNIENNQEGKTVQNEESAVKKNTKSKKRVTKAKYSPRRSKRFKVDENDEELEVAEDSEEGEDVHEIRSQCEDEVQEIDILNTDVIILKEEFDVNEQLDSEECIEEIQRHVNESIKS